MYKKVIKKLKQYADVVCIGRKKYAQNYINYAGGYLDEFKDLVIFSCLNLELITDYVDWQSNDFKNGSRKGNADLMAWTAEMEQKKKRRKLKLRNDLIRFCKVVLDNREDLDICLLEIEHIDTQEQKYNFLVRNKLLGKYKDFDFDSILLARYACTYRELELKKQLQEKNIEIEKLKEKLRDNTKTVCEELIKYVTKRTSEENKCQILYLDELTLKGGAK